MVDTYLKAIAESVCTFVTGFLNACTHTWPQSMCGPHAKRAGGVFRARAENRFKTTKARKRKKCNATEQHSPDQWQ
jgi:hypothetical protein